MIWKEITSCASINNGVLLHRGYYIQKSGCRKKICKNSAQNLCAERSSFTTRNKIRKVWKNEVFLMLFFFPMGRSMAKASREHEMVQLSCSVYGKISQLIFHQALNLFHGWWSELLMQHKPLFHIAAPSYVKHEVSDSQAQKLKAVGLTFHKSSSPIWNHGDILS